MKDLFPNFALKELSTFAAIIVIFIYNFVLQVKMSCSCKEQGFSCDLYMAAPCFCLFTLRLWTDKMLQRACRYTCFFKSGHKFWKVLMLHFFKATFVGLLWPVFVFINGDWYVCCKNDKSTQQASLACKKKDDFTAKDHKNIAELKNKSFGIGIGILLGVLFVAAVISCINQGINRNIVYDKLILEEEAKVLKEVLTTETKKQLTTEIEGRVSMKDWGECLNVAEKLRKTGAEATSEATSAAATSAAPAATGTTTSTQSTARTPTELQTFNRTSGDQNSEAEPLLDQQPSGSTHL